jgi:hypothetical protein
MASLDRSLRKDLENVVKKARRVAEAGARQAVEQLAVGHHEAWSALSLEQRKLRNRLRAHGRQLGDKLDANKGMQGIERLTGECAYEHWHRLLFARFLAENDLLVEPQSGMALSLDECRELAREQRKDWLVLASDFAQRMLPQIFRAGDPVLDVALPPEKRQELEAILERLPREVFIADDSLGWVYQFWQADQKDSVNASENKIGADELPAVTQLFTEDYMVLFLLHNTLGAWWAGKLLVARPDLARSAASEDECRAACAVQGIDWSYLRFVREGDVWRPAAGTFPGWPTAAKDLTVLDPCMGSGHFLAFALQMLVALRREEEKLSAAEAVDGVLRDNLFGLELDPRCTQIAAFNVGLTAWRLAGYRALPALNLACTGLAINAPVATWTALAGGDASAENAMKQLYELFRQAPTLGSLIDPTRVGGELFVAHYDKIRMLLSSALATERSDDAELTVVAHGIARAAAILADQYTMIATNVPYLGIRKQSAELRDYLEVRHPEARHDLATAFIERALRLLSSGGTLAVVAPQTWMLMQSYRAFREKVLRTKDIAVIVNLGPGAFETISGEVVKASLAIVNHHNPTQESTISGIDAVADLSVAAKADALRDGLILGLPQNSQLSNPDGRIIIRAQSNFETVESYASSLAGIQNGDSPRFLRQFWEVQDFESRWAFQRSAAQRTAMFCGMDTVIDYDLSGGHLRADARWRREALHDSDQRGKPFWGRRGVAVSRMADLPCTLYLGELYDQASAVLVPKDPADLCALWCFCASDEYSAEVRKIDSKLGVTSATLVKIPVDIDRWRSVADAQHPGGLPRPHSSNPTQWVFDGSPAKSDHPLQTVIARLVGYHWPRQSGLSFMDCPPLNSDSLGTHSDDDGIVCLPSVRGEAPAAERVRALLADAFGADWSAQKLNELLADAGFNGKAIEDWLRDGYFDEHCVLFDQRPFVWQIWDGRKDGFSALLNYHRLAAPNGEGRRILDKLTHTYLGDWLDRQRADQKAGLEGADGRVAAAEHLKRELEEILEGQPPYDIFIRWKPVRQQPVGWEPDIDDGVRVNIRPFMTAKPLSARGKNACILRVAPKIKWDKDRGKEPVREKADFPWFWGWDEEKANFTGGAEFDGNRWNNLHYSPAVKLAARERAEGRKS